MAAGKEEHLFVSQKGGLLPHWREAFPNARSALPGAAADKADGAGLIWVRLAAGESIPSLLAAVRQRFGERPLVALSDRPDDEEALACFGAGARAYCNAHALPEVLRQVAGVVRQGGLWIGESLMQRLLVGTARLPEAAPAPVDWAAPLTERERQVAQAVAAGASNKEIARQLGITERTIKAHTGAIFEKLAVRDRLQLSLLVHGRQAR
jgi:DNA-binding NarL/FixJ family response regulator